MTKWSYVLVFGVLALLIGIAMPSTETIYSESCTNGGYVGDVYVSGSCYGGYVEVPNPTKGAAMGWGFVLTLLGVAGSYISGQKSKQNGPGDRPADNEYIRVTQEQAEEYIQLKKQMERERE